MMIMLIVHKIHSCKYLKNYMIKKCPVRTIKKKSKYKDHPWITKGLQNACKKNNTLYKEFIRQRT